jgi:uncharacterized Zn finger protein
MTSVPNALHLECPDCGDRTVHEVLRGRMGKDQDVIDATVRCQECGKISSVVVREPKGVKVAVIVSDLGESRREELELDEEEMVSVEDEMFVGDLPVIVSSIEVGGRRVKRALPGEITTLWVKRFDKVRVKIAINKVQRTNSVDMDFLPDEEFIVGDMMTVGREEVVITSIKTKDGMARRGAVPAREIVRIFTKAARHINQ